MSQKGKIRKILLLIGGLGLCAGGAVLGSGIFVKSFIQTQIRLSGFPDAHIETLAFTPSGLVIDHISLDGHDFSTVDQVSASFDWGDLIFNRHVETLSVKDITLMAEIEDGGTFRLAGWDTTLPKSSSEDNKFPFDTLLLQGITLDLDTPEGNFRVQGKAHIEAKSDNSQSINFSVWSEQKLLSFALDGTGRISPDGNFSVDFNLPEARLELSDFQATRLSGSGKYNAPANGAAFASGQVLAGSIKTANVLLQDVALLFDSTKVEPFYFKTSPAGYPDIDIIGRWNRTPPEQFELSIEAKQGEDILSLFQKEPDRMTKDWMSRLNPLTVQFALPKDVFDQDAKTAAWAIQAGSVSPLKISGTARYDSNSFKLSFVPTQIDASLISDYFPFKDKFGVKFSDGTIGLQGEIHAALPFEKDTIIDGPLQLTPSDLSGDLNGFLFEGLTVSPIRVSTLFPWSIGDGTQFSQARFRMINHDDVIAKGHFNFSGAQDKGIKLSNIGLDFAGGRISASPVTLMPNAKSISTSIELHQVQLDQLSKLFGQDSFSAQGQLDGVLPIEIKNGHLNFKSGTLNSIDQGYFKYTPSEFPASLQGDDPRMQTVRQALSDFQFSVLSLDMDGSLDGKMTSTLKASGTSPVFGTRPIELNLNLEGDLGPVLQQALQAGDLSTTLRSIKGDKK